MTPDLSTQVQFPDDDFAPQSQRTRSTPPPSGEGWYGGPIRVTLDGVTTSPAAPASPDPYRFNGGTSAGLHRARSRSPPRARTTLEYRAIDGAGNAEAYKSIPLRIDTRAPHDPDRRARAPRRASTAGTTARSRCARGADNGRARASAGPSTAISDDEDWQPVTRTSVLIDEAGSHASQYRSTDVARQRRGWPDARTQGRRQARRNDRAPINGAAPSASYAGAVRVVAHRRRRRGQRASAATEYRVDGGAWTEYTGAFDARGQPASTGSTSARGTALGNVEL